MKNLKSFLYPKKKENLKFVLSEAFTDENGTPIEWEMRELTAEEGIEVRQQIGSGGDAVQILAAFVAEALVYPNLHDKELLDELSQIKGRPVFSARDALFAVVPSNRLMGKLCSIYKQYNELDVDISGLIEQLKK